MPGRLTSFAFVCVANCPLCGIAGLPKYGAADVAPCIGWVQCHGTLLRPNRRWQNAYDDGAEKQLCLSRLVSSNYCGTFCGELYFRWFEVFVARFQSGFGLHTAGFAQCCSEQANAASTVRMSYMEIYNDGIYDLLNSDAFPVDAITGEIQVCGVSLYGNCHTKPVHCFG